MRRLLVSFLCVGLVVTLIPCFFLIFHLFSWKTYYGKSRPIKSIERKYRKAYNYDKIKPVDDDSYDKFWYYPYDDPGIGRRAINKIDSPSIVTFVNQTVDEARYFYRYLFQNMYRYIPRFLLYPFPVTYTPTDEASKHFPEGGFISMDTQRARYQSTFLHYEAEEEVTFYRSKALYDTSIAVMKIDTMHNDIMKDLFFESDVYCSMLVTYIGHWGVDCIQGKDFQEGGATKFVYLNSTQIVTLLNIDNFGVLVFPDLIFETEDLILEMFGTEGIESIKTFVDAGGVLYAGGKSIALLELMGMFPAGSYHADELVYSETNEVRMTQCNTPAENLAQDDNDPNFTGYTLCYGTPEDSYILSTYRAGDINNARGIDDVGVVRAYSSFDYTDENLRVKRMSDGGSYSPDSSTSLYSVLHMDYGDGHVVANLANPGYHSDSFGWFYGALFLAMGKDMAYKRSIDFEEGTPIPAMESGVRLTMNTSIYNVYNKPMTDLTLTFYLPNLVDALEIETNGDCIETELPSISSLLNDTGFSCGWDTLDAYEEATFNIRVEILDASVTQMKTNVLMSYALIEYTAFNDRVMYFPAGSFRTNTEVAALLRCNVNPDPSSFYPIKGRGNYIDNVMPCENKEDTLAYEVEHIAIVPLISPAVDGGDQSKLIEILRFWNEYYDAATNLKEEYPFPMVDLGIGTRDYDYLDYKFLSGKGVILNADWDTPVKAQKKLREGGFPDLENSTIDVGMVNYSTTVTNQNQVLLQEYFADSDMFFEHATQRLLVFVDTTTEEGAAAKFDDIHVDLDVSEIIPGTDVTKIEFSFIRADIYFYDSGDQYVLPVGLNYSHVISLDHYPKYSLADDSGIEGCYDGLSKIQEEGYFDKAQEGGLKYNEWGNELINRCDKVVIDPTDLEEMTGGEVTFTRYILPIHDDRVQAASDLMGFDEDTGEFIEYPDVKFKIGYEVIIILDPAITRRGGRFDLDLSPHTFKADPFVFFSADHVAFNGETEGVVEGGSTISASFKRGLMPNENWGKESIITMFIEELDAVGDVDAFNFTMDLYELKYDITQHGFEEFEPRTEDTILTARKSTFFSLPAIRMHFRLNRSDDGDTSMKEYELIEPLARYGVYYQEVLKHRTVWGLAESHLVTDPGQVSKSGGFSLISQVGISSIPFIDYLSVGAGQVIPAGLETTRVTWRDIWGRKWVQPLRSVFPDVPPIPPPLRNFMMTTTFEVTDPITGERSLEWDSELAMDILVKIKLKNNYPKYFEITTCTDNQVYSIPRTVPSRVFEWPFADQTTVDETEKEFLSLGHRAYYGECFMDDDPSLSAGVILSGVPLDEDMEAAMQDNLEHCADNLANASSCIEALRGIPTVSRRIGDGTDHWNYAPEVFDYYPYPYIKDNMWDLTHYDYDDNAFDKAYKYHMDNNLPNLDILIKKPHNIIAQPIWKGYGFQIEFDRDYSLVKYPDYKGWWSDNLQNKDHTVLAGHDVSYDISVNKEIDELIPGWTEIIQFEDTGSDKSNNVNTALSNIYACMFNRRRPKMMISNDKTYYVQNIYPNNVIPIIPSLDRYGPEYTSWDCDLSLGMYDNYNISEIDNTVYTTDARDWLYFGANLRGNAFETVNIAYKLIPFEERQFEGLTKVNDGGRYVYWNPANGPNSFLIVDNPVSVIRSVRCDCTLEIELFPKSTTTFNSEIYHLVSISDPEEIDREYPLTTTIEHYGFGDVSTSVYVGGTEGSIAMLNPGDTTYAKITVYNNAGFDFEMFGGAIEFDIEGYMPINADDLMKNTMHAIKVPTAYNFMSLSISEEMRDYIEIIPSDHNSKVASLFFDFQNINTVTIQDGFKADYFYKLTLADVIPADLRGRIHEIDIDIVESHFDQLPSYNDPAQDIHDYHIDIPPISFGINFGEEALPDYQGKVYQVLGQSSDLSLKLPMLEDYEVLGIKPVTKEEIGDLRTYAADAENYASLLRDFWADIDDERELLFTSDISEEYDGFIEYNFDLSSLYELFPMREYSDRPATAEFDFLIYTKASQIPSGFSDVDYQPLFTYNACQKREKETIMETYPNWRSVYANGPFFQAEYQYELLSRVVDGVEYPNECEFLYPYDYGSMRIDLTVTNIGSDVAYNVNITLTFNRETITPMEEMMSDPEYNTNNYEFYFDYSDDEYITMTIATGYDFTPSVYEIIPIYVSYIPPVVVRENEGEVTEELIDQIPENLMVIEFNVANMDLVNTPGQVCAEQQLDSYGVAYTIRERDRVWLVGSEQNTDTCEVQLDAEANFEIVMGERIWYQFFMRNYSAFRSEAEQDQLAWHSIHRSQDSSVVAPYPCGQEMEFRVETQEYITGSLLASDNWTMTIIPWELLFSIGAALAVLAAAFYYYCLICVFICMVAVGGSAALGGHKSGALPTFRKSILFGGIGPWLGIGDPDEEKRKSVKKMMEEEGMGESEYVTDRYYVQGRFIDVIEKRPNPPPKPKSSKPKKRVLFKKKQPETEMNDTAPPVEDENGVLENVY